MSNKTFYDSQGRPVHLGTALGSGGEGAVHDVADGRRLVAKIYHKPVDEERAAKLRTLTEVKTRELLNIAAWPEDTLHVSPRGRVAGLLMPKVDGKPIHQLYSPKSRLAEFPQANWKFLLQAAANLARAFAVIHDHGHVVADVNHGNAYVTAQATIRLIDCDSFQVSRNGRTFLCGVGVSTHTPPELQQGSLRVLRTPNHDAFGLAVLIFQILFMGRHPFSGQYLGAGDMSLEKAIQELRFAYGSGATTRLMRQPPFTPDLTTASSQVALLFERSFSAQGKQNGVRTAAREWVHALESIQAKSCSRSPAHTYLATLPACPWCEIEGKSGGLLFSFISVTVPRAGGGFDLSVIWSQIAAVSPPGSPPPLPSPAGFPATPSPAGAQAAKARRVRQVLGGAVGLAGAVLGILALQEYGCMGGLAIIVALIVAQSILQKADAFSLPYKRALEQARSRFQALETRWSSEAGEVAFHQKLGELQKLRQEHLDLPVLRQRKMTQLQADLRLNQLRKFLDRHRIEDAKIPGIGVGRTATLESYGIETADDVVYQKILQVPRFGPSLASRLMDWRQSVERRFVFDASRGVDPADRTRVERELEAHKSQIEQRLLRGPGELRQAAQQTLVRRQAILTQLEMVAREVAQAEADLRGR